MIAPRALAAPSTSDAPAPPAADASASRAHRRRHPLALLGAALVAGSVLLTGGLPTPAAASDPPLRPSSLIADELEETGCPVDVPVQDQRRVTCGVLTVPESRAPGSDPAKTVQLPVAVIASRSDDPEEDPLVFPTTGGPGAGSLDSLSYFLDHADWASQNRDIIVIEQRGDALAEPTLDCPELDTSHFVRDGVVLSGEKEATVRLAQLQKCHDRLIEEGRNLAAYTSAESAADLTDLRSALGYDEWNLYGLSYGTRIALTVMRDRPQGLRAVILDGVVPPQVREYEQMPAGFRTALDTLAADCAADADCARLYPDLEASLATVLDRAEKSPLTVTVKSPEDRSPARLTVDDTDLVRDVFDAFQNVEVVRILPFLIDRLAHGDTDAAAPLAQRSIDARGRITEGLQLSIDCAEEAPFNDDAAILAAREADPILSHFAPFDGFREDCAVWAVPAASAIETDPVVSGIPTLLTNGAYDPHTPRAWSEAAASTLSAHYLYEFPGMGHGAVWANRVDDCAATIAGRFLDDPTVEPDSTCIADMTAPDFLTATDIHATSALYRLESDVIHDRDPITIGVGVASVLVLAATLIYAAVYGLLWLRRRRGDAPGGTVLAAAASAGLNLLYVAGLALVMANTEPILLAFGLPAGAWPLLLLPFTAICAAVLLIVLLVLAWMRREGSLFHRVVLSISAAASVVFALWLTARGLLLL
ncbi:MULTISPECIES: alpha/beta hydrolase [unclassified Microbacterium]|uniref:alpha/beta hydrolase n=1 Tax=unclassified Microbacterium TaxID=2609290 RepID=UPI00214C502F|nr:MULTISPECIES: alpha/beta hydrolase [unclassified Microbacterium]MCR2808994.1 alpha/beta hydrolase [Microbacterium sp. zg.B185]WIM18593.1 alpha/beta hydrolase [Microbacterium sp. zg-B185]